MEKKLSHLRNGNPEMVDVGEKSISRRTAVATAVVHFPGDVFNVLEQQGFTTPKGAILHTANIAGVMAVKRTSELIPLCHPLAISKCAIRFEFDRPDLHIFCEVTLDGKTGVEMEALTGASVAALTVYDMCKALSHGIEINRVRLLSKTGGKSDYSHEA